MKVWDLSTRLYHWAQALLLVALIASGIIEQGPHIPMGLALFTLLIWRILWGFMGSQTSRFSNFIKGPMSVYHYLKGREKEKPGHNPAGGWMVLIMLLTLGAQCFSGLAVAGLLENIPFFIFWLDDDIMHILENSHAFMANVLLCLIAIHLVAVTIYQLRSKPLVMAMLTGIQKHQKVSDELYFAPQIRALVMLVAALFVTMAIIAIA